jgi:hypothetical protein
MTTYKADPSASSTFGSTNLVGLQSFTINGEGDETIHGSDGKPFAIGAFYDNLKYTVSVVLSDKVTAKVGDVGTLTLKAAGRALGEGVTGTMTFTSAANMATVSSTSDTVNHAGVSERTINFTVVSADGTTDCLTVA